MEVVLTQSEGRSREGAEAFLDRNRAWVFHLALQIVGQRETAEDVAQEALVRATRQRSTLKSPEAERTWLRKITVRCALNALKARKPTVQFDDDCQEAPDVAGDLAVHQTLARLEPAHQVILALALGEGLSYQELAATLDIPEGTVASRLHAAKAAFRVLWEQ